MNNHAQHFLQVLDHRPRLLDLALLVLICGLPLVAFWPVTIGQKTWADGDLFDYNYPLLFVIAQQWKAGHVPLWNPYIFGGTPLLAAMQGGVFYPLNVLFLVLPEWLAFGYSILAHYSLMGAFMFLYLRSLRLARGAATVGGLVFMFSGFALGHLGHASSVRTLPWLPLILFSLEMWRRSGRLGYVSLGSVALGAMLVAGHPQIPFYALMVSAAYGTFLVLSSDRLERTRLVQGGLAIAVFGACLAAVQIVPTAFAFRNYLRPTDGSYDYFGSYSLHPLLLTTLVFPRIIPTNLAEMPGYVGIATLVLAAIGALSHVKERIELSRFFAGVAAVSLVLVMGKYTPLHPVLYRLPVYNLFTAPARNWFEFTFAVAVLAAMGTQVVVTTRYRTRDRRLGERIIIGFLLLLLFGGIAIRVLVHTPLRLPTEAAALATVSIQDPNIIRRLPLVLGSLALLYFGPRWRRLGSSSILVASLTVLLIVDLLSFGGSIYGLYPPAVYTEPPSSLEAVAEDRGTFRVVSVQQSLEDTMGIARKKEALLRNFNSVHKVESINGFDSVMLRQINEVSGGIMPTYGLLVGTHMLQSPQFVRFLDLFNVKYIILPRDAHYELDPQRYGVVYQNEMVAILENTAALPRFFSVPIIRPVVPEVTASTLATGLVDGEPFDAGRLALVEASTCEQLLATSYLGHNAAGNSEAVLSNMLEFLGHALVRSDARAARTTTTEEIMVATKWRATQPVPGDYTISVDLTDEQGRVVYQEDHLLGSETLCGSYPTSKWREGQVIQDYFLVPACALDEDVALDIRIGVWIPETREYLEARSQTLVKDQYDRLVIGHIVPSDLDGHRLDAELSPLSVEPDGFRLTTQTGIDSLLVAAVNFEDGWVASVDGVHVPVYRVDGALVGILLPEGRHSVVLQYRPAAFFLGVALSSCSLSLVLAIWVRGIRKWVSWRK